MYLIGDSTRTSSNSIINSKAEKNISAPLNDFSDFQMRRVWRDVFIVRLFPINRPRDSVTEENCW